MKHALAAFLVAGGILMSVQDTCDACGKGVTIRRPVGTATTAKVEYLPARSSAGTFWVPLVNGHLPTVYEDKDAFGRVYQRRFDWSRSFPYNKNDYGTEVVYNFDQGTNGTRPSDSPRRRSDPSPFSLPPADDTITRSEQRDPPREAPRRPEPPRKAEPDSFSLPPPETTVIKRESLQDYLNRMQTDLHAMQQTLDRLDGRPPTGLARK